jgi:osmotically-inducible protein OsmY
MIKDNKMNSLRDSITAIGILVILATGLVACDKPGPAETAGKKIDQTVGEAGKQIGIATDRVVEKLGEQGDKAVLMIDDAEITAKVKAAIFAEPGLKTLQISVNTMKGEVTLSGSVDSSPSSDMAKILAGAVSGVKEVKNRLAIKPIR